MQFERGILMESFDVTFKRGKIFLTAIALGVALGYLQSLTSQNIPTMFVGLFIIAIMATSVHQTIILGYFDEIEFVTMKGVRKYVLRLLGIVMLSVIPMLLAIFLFMQIERTAVVGLAITAWISSYCLILSMYGTCLPAIAIGGDATWSSAFHRGRKTFGYVSSRLIFLNGALIIVALLVFSQLVAVMKVNGQNPIWVDIVVAVSANSFSVYITVMASTILSRAYMIAENMDAPNAGSNSRGQANFAGRSLNGNLAKTKQRLVTSTQPMFGGRRNTY